MSHQLTPLGDLVPGWSESDPDTGAALLAAEVEKLSQAAHAVRRHIIDALGSSERTTIPNPLAAYDTLRRRHLRPVEHCWSLYQLDRDKRTVREPRPDGGTQNVRHVARKVPRHDELRPLPPGGKWLVIWHGSVDVLSIDGVPQRLAHLQATTPIADVLFYDSAHDDPVLHSLRKGNGVSNGKTVRFPDNDALRDATPQPRKAS